MASSSHLRAAATVPIATGAIAADIRTAMTTMMPARSSNLP
jgi:hypothetical protein